MVRHQTKPCQPHRRLFVSLPHQVHKRGEVVVLVKDVTEAMSPVQDMADKTTSCCSGCSWDQRRFTPAFSGVK